MESEGATAIFMSDTDPPNHLDDKVDSDQKVVKKEVSVWSGTNLCLSRRSERAVMS